MITFVNTVNKIKYNIKYNNISLEVGNKTFFILYNKYKIKGVYRKLKP